MEKPEISSREEESRSARIGRMAEWSKALALGASPKGRGFKPHHYHTFFKYRLNYLIFKLITH